MDTDSRVDDLHHSDRDENGIKGTWYCGQGTGWTFYPEGTPEITLGNGAMRTPLQVSIAALAILENEIDIAKKIRRGPGLPFEENSFSEY